MTKFACPIDAAQQREAEITADALAAIRGLVPQEKDALSDEDLECTQCGGEISPARAVKGYDICIDCARDNEKYGKQFNKSRSRSYDYDD